MKIKNLILFCFLCCGTFIWSQLALPPSGNNQKAIVKQYIGGLVGVTITYSSPDVTGPDGQSREGKIWGDLVPYGLNELGFGLNNPSPWRAGANENTTISFSHDVLFQGKTVKAGTYGFHIIPKENEPWTIILTKNHNAWGSYFYDEKHDVLRVNTMPAENHFHEWLTFEFTERMPTYAVGALMWENIKLPFKIEVPDYNALYIKKIQTQLEGQTGFMWQNWNQAANFALKDNRYTDLGLQWIDMALNTFQQKNFTTLQTKSKLLHEKGQIAEAADLLDKAIQLPGTTAQQIHGYGRELIGQGKKAEALKIFKYNHKRFKGAWPTEVGLARGYSAIGEYSKALAHAEKALIQAPNQPNKNNLKKSIEKLRKEEDINLCLITFKISNHF